MAWKEQTRLILPTLVVSVLLVFLTGVAAWSLHQQQRESSRRLIRYVADVQAADEMMRTHEQIQFALDEFLVTDDRSGLASIAVLSQQAEDWLAQMDELASGERDREIIARLRAGHEHFDEKAAELLAQRPAVEQRPAFVSDLDRLIDNEIFLPAREFQRVSRDQLEQLAIDDQVLTDRLGWTLWLLGISGALAGLLAGYSVSRGVERKLVQHQNAMTRSEQLATLGRIAAALAHELRNPLTSLRIIAQAATSAGDRVSLDEADFAILTQEIERLDGSIQTFLDYARPPRPQKRTCVLQSLVRQTVSLVERRATLIGVGICDELPTEPILVEVDAAQIKQVILNLLLNALEASPEGGTITLRVASTSFDEIGNSGRHPADAVGVVQLEIVDTGSGLPDGLGTRIFDAFVSTKETGTGLGLAICKRIIEDHGGEIGARNADDGSGAVFYLRFPRVPVDDDRDRPAPAARHDH